MEKGAMRRTFKYNKEAKSHEPSKKQIARYKDFASISHQYERITKRPKRPLYKDPKLFLLLVLLGIVFLLIFLEEKG
jgi:zona occludens toxin (predicted ATPase)